MTEREDLPEPRSYLQAARFSGERPAGRAYERIQALLFRARADLSAYRFHLDRVWHVAVLGQEPPQNARPADSADVGLRGTSDTA